MKLYGIFLHVALVALTITSLYGAHQNQKLRQRLDPETVQLEVGQQVKPVTVNSLDGDSRLLSWDDTNPDRLLLVFTTSCPACKQNQVFWQSLHRTLDNDVEIVGISLDSPEATRIYREEHGLPFEVVVAADREAFASAYEISVVPFTFHIAGDGSVQGAWRGVLTDANLTEVEASISDPARRS